jgi:hypothetical protein
MSFSRRVLHMDPWPPARSEASSPTRRDTRPPHVLREAGIPRALGDLGSCPLHARSRGDSRGTIGFGGQKLTGRASEHFPAHTTL